MKYILHACHDRPCGGHFVDKMIAYKVLHSGYYWPSIFKDAAKYFKGWDSCQRMGRPMSSDQIPLQPQVMIEPFEKWALDFVGPIVIADFTTLGESYFVWPSPVPLQTP